MAGAGSHPRPDAKSDRTGQDRAATVAELAAAIAHIAPDGSDPSSGASGREPAQRRTGSRSRPPAGSAERSGRAAGSAAGSDRGEPGRRPSTAGRRPPPDDPAGPSGDDPGDPESVAKTICLRQLTGRARSRSELAETLRRREIPPEVAERVLNRFTEVGLIDDAAYAQAFVANKHRDRGLGRAALRTELRRKGIDGAAADRALQTIDGESERRRAAELVAKRLDSAIFAGLPAARRRLLGLLARRGYSASLAASVVSEALRGYTDPVELEAADEQDWAEADDANS